MGISVMNFLNGFFNRSKFEESSVTYDVTNRLNAKALAYYVASSYVADTISKCEIKHFKKNKAIKDNLYYLLNIKPNPNQTASEFKTKMIFKLFYEGEVLVFEHKGFLYVADNFLKERRPFDFKGDLFSSITMNYSTMNITRNASDVFYLELDDSNLKRLVDSMLDDYAELYSYSFENYKASNQEKYKLTLDMVEIGTGEDVARQREQRKAALSNFINNSKAVYIQHRGQNLEQISSISRVADSSDIRELRKEMFELTAQAFKMPVSMMYGTTTNTKEITANYLTFRIEPLAKKISEELTSKFCGYDGFVNEEFFDVDTTSIMHHDVFEVANDIYQLQSCGLYCVDELREKLGEAPLGTEQSQTYYITKNFLADESNKILKGGDENEE